MTFLRIATTSCAVLALVGTARGAIPRAAAPVTSFAGQDSRQSTVNPADVQVAVGPTAVVQAVNSAVAIYAPDGTLQQQQSLGQFFSGDGVDRSRDATTDPRVLWDPVSGRFFAVMFDITRLEIVLAMTITSDPLGPRAIVALPSNGCTDQPRLGTSDNVVVVTDDLFSSCTGFGRFVGGEVYVLNKQDLLNGAPSPRRARFGPDARFASVTPATSLVSTQNEYLVAVGESNDTLQVFSVPSSDVTSLPFKTLKLKTPFAETEEAQQRGSLQPVDPGDNRIQNAVFDAGRLWATSSVGCGSNRNCARVVELDPAVPHLVRETQVTLPNGRSLLYPALMPDARGNVVMAFSYTSANDFPGFGYTFVRPDGQVAAPVDALPGTAPQNSGRFGDYSGAARDPADPSRIWLSAQVGAAVAGSSLDWASGVAATTVPAQAPAIVSTLARNGVVTAGIYAEGQPTTFRLEYGSTTRYGTRTAALPLPAGAREAPVALRAAGLPGALVHARVVATNATGTSVGPDVVVRMPPGAPRVSYPAPAARATVLRATVSAAGLPTTVRFEYGTSRTYGNRTAARRLGGSATAAVVAARVRLQPGRVYHFRVVATNAKGTVRGPDRAVRA